MSSSRSPRSPRQCAAKRTIDNIASSARRRFSSASTPSVTFNVYCGQKLDDPFLPGTKTPCHEIRPKRLGQSVESQVLQKRVGETLEVSLFNIWTLVNEPCGDCGVVGLLAIDPADQGAKWEFLPMRRSVENDFIRVIGE